MSLAGTDGTRWVGRFAIPASHPALPGHFPGRPIVPGVTLLDEALALIRVDLGSMPLPGPISAKFLAVVLPDQVVEVRCGPPGARIAFTCSVGDVTVLRGQLG